MPSAPNLLQMFDQAHAFLGAGELRKSADLCRELLNIDPQFPKGYYLMSLLFRATEDFAKSLEFADNAVRLAPEESSFHFNRGQVLFCMSQWKEAEQSFKTASELDPGNVLALVLRADSHSQLGDFETATALFSRARDLLDIPEIDEHEALCLITKGDMIGAELMIDRVIARRPDYDGGYIHKGKLCVARGQGSEAQAHFTRALACNPNSQEAQQCLAALKQHQPWMGVPASQATH